MTVQFDPNSKKPPTVPEWATYIPDRNPQFKIHKQRGHALNAFQDRSNVILYRFINGKWEEYYRLEDLDNNKIEKCQNCEKDIPLTKWNTRYSYMKWFDRDTDHPRYLAICRDCYHQK